ncbi:MAG: adenylate cyclase [Parasphingorhabdus sp.]
MSDQPSRKLAVILHADIVGSTELVQKNESIAHLRMRDVFKQFSTTIEAFDGIVREIRGDALLAEFARASDAVGAAIQFQTAISESNIQIIDDIQPTLRVGIAMGEVIVADGTITGAGVVLAQRLEQLASSGGTVIQGAAYETIPRRLPFSYKNLGEKTLKGFEEPVRAYQVTSAEGDNTQETETRVSQSKPVVLAVGKPSIAVLPFTNMSDHADQQFFSDGISEDIITELSRFKTLLVIARNSSFRFRDTTTDSKEIGEILGVQYLVEGSVRRAGNRIRITVQLVEAASGNHVWGERYDRDLSDIFELQDEVTRNIVSVLPGRVQADIVDHASRKPTENMRAYELMLQGKAYRDLLSAEGNAKARLCCEKAIQLDPRYARAYMYLSDSYIVDIWLGLADEKGRQLALQLAREAAALDGNDVYIQDHLGFAYLSQEMWPEAEAQFEKTIAKIVNEAESMAWCGYAFLLLDKKQKALDIVLKARRLDPLHPPAIDWILGQIYFFEQRYDEVIELLIGEALLNSVAHGFLTGAYAYLGRVKEAEKSLQMYIENRKREFTSRNLKIDDETIDSLAGSYRVMWRNPASFEKFAEGLRLAGLPDHITN